MKYIAALLMLVSTSGFSYSLSVGECYVAAKIAGQITWQRDHGTTKEEILGNIEREKASYPREELYELVIQITGEVYDLAELNPDQHYDRLLGECTRTEGKFDTRI